MKKQLATLLLGLAITGCGNSTNPAPLNPSPMRLTILHLNDANSALLNAGEGLEDFGGVARFATKVAELRGDGSSTLILDGGDSYAAGFVFEASLDKGVPFYDTLAEELLGVEASAVGNQNFDYGPEVFARYLSGFSRLVPYLSANLDYSGEPDLAALENVGALARSTVVTKNGRRIGLVGLTTPRLPFISSPRNVTVDSDLVADLQQEVDELQQDGVNIVILLSHLDTLQETDTLLAGVRGVDLVVAATPFEILADPGTVLVPGDESLVTDAYPHLSQDIDGAAVPVVTTGGYYKYVGRLVVDFDDSGVLVAVDESSGPVRVAGGNNADAVAPDPLLESVITAPVTQDLAQKASTVVATSQVALNATDTALRSGDTNAGNLVADALLQQGVALAPGFAAAIPDVAIVNAGGIPANEIIPAGDVTALDIADLLPFNDFLSVVDQIPPAQFKELLENAVSKAAQLDGRFAQVAGFRFTWDPNGTAQQVDGEGTVLVPGTRIQEIVLDDNTVIVTGGQVAPNAPNLNLATIDFLARGGDEYPFRGDTFTNLGITYQTALLNYLDQALGGTITSTQYPEGGEGRITSL